MNNTVGKLCLEGGFPDGRRAVRVDGARLEWSWSVVVATNEGTLMTTVPATPPSNGALEERSLAIRWLTRIILMSLALVGSGAAWAGCPEVAIVSFTIAPGEVGSPVETVTVARRGEERTLTLTHKGFKAAARTETLPLEQEEFDKVWAIVIRDKLLEFEPEQRTGTAFDYGRRTLRTETCETPADRPRVHEARWTGPIENQNRVSPLVEKLARVARSHAKEVTLELFVPQGGATPPK
jgi:hypothetical protein